MAASLSLQLSEEIYHSDTSTVSRGTDNDRPVVLKMLNRESSSALLFPQYRREYELLRELDGVEGVIRAYDCREVQSTLVIVEEDIGGKSLREILEHDRPGPAEALRLAVRLADLLGRLHSHHVIHKDFNPSNIIWNPETDELRVIDFGISSQLCYEDHAFLNPNQIEGTLAYISPEQTGRVNRQLDNRSDLYSFGVTLYELFTGTLPFAELEGIELIHAHIALVPTAPSDANPQVSAVVSQLIMRLLSKSADERYQSAWGVKHDLQRCLEQLQQGGRIEPFTLGEQDRSVVFRLPQKLYGRDRELNTIMQAFAQITAGGSELLLVAGPSGTGKSSLVHEVHKPLTEKRGYFVDGKFDQSQRDLPFYAWRQAFEQLVGMILKEDEETFVRWRGTIQQAVGSMGKVLADVVPSLELIIGPQPEVQPLAGEQALNRLNYVFGNFIKAVCRKDHPLVIFIDDWQWADSASLALLRFLINVDSVDHLLLIGAYRNNEVESIHPFSLLLDELIRGEVNLSTIAIRNLDLSDVELLIGDALPNLTDKNRFVELAYAKTQGNAFFLRQFLLDLYREGLLYFDQQQQRWSWKAAEVEARQITDNVVDLMTAKLCQLPGESQRVLRFAACIGNRFELATLATILGLSSQQTAAYLDAALKEEVIKPIGFNYRYARQKENTADIAYQFIHDRVQQAAYGLSDQQAQVQVHYDIAHCLLNKYDAAAREKLIFDIVRHYNSGRPLISSQKERDELAELNFAAGKRAKEAIAFGSALHYFQTALELWDSPGALKRDTYRDHLLAAAETAFLCQAYGQMEQWLNEYLQANQQPLERARAQKIRLQAYIAQNRLSDAVDVALNALEELGVQFSKSPSQLQVIGKLLQTRRVLSGKSLAELHALPPIKDPAKLEVMDLLGLAIPPAYWTSAELLALIVFQMVRESVQHGYSPNAGYGYSWWGIMQCSLLGNIDNGYQFGKFGVDLAKEHNLSPQRPLFFWGWIIRQFKHPVRESVQVLREAYLLALEKGDFEYASYALNNRMQAHFHAGRELPTLLEEMEEAHRDLERFKVGSSLYWHDIWWQTALNFVNPSESPHLLAGHAYQEKQSLPQHLKENDASTLFLFYCAKLMLSVYFGDVERAVAHAKLARSYAKGGAGMFALVLFHYYESLALLAEIQANKLTGIERRLRLVKVLANQRKLKRWAGFSPENHLHRWYLVKAQYLRVTGKQERAVRYYDLAIEHAREQGFTQDEALASELTAECYREWDRAMVSRVYFEQALLLYNRWGARAKVQQLEALPVDDERELAAGDRVATTLSRTRTSDTTGKSGALSGQTLDLEAVAEAARALSGEIVYETLIKTLLKIVIENAGAQKAMLISSDPGRIGILAEAKLADGVQINLTPQFESIAGQLPVSMIRYVARTFKTLVMEDASCNAEYGGDPYVRDVQPKSVLCEPILRQGKLEGLLYLENNLTRGAFTADRLALLKLISAQAAISIANASLYTGLEEKVRERTQELEDSLLVQEKLNDELRHSSHELEKAYAQLRDANRKLREQATTDGLTGLSNRRYFSERLQQEVNRCLREQRPMGILLADIDHFKRFNDRYGHLAGDDCLKQVAHTFSSTFNRSTDLVARFGGEEFVVAIPLADATQTQQAAEQLRAAVEALAIPHDGNADYGMVTVSVGAISFLPEPKTDPMDMVGIADEALYQAKAEGRNRVVIKDPVAIASPVTDLQDQTG